MTDQEINIAVAEACGWKNCQTLDGGFVGENPQSKRVIVAWEYQSRRELKEIPNYCADLNAMHEAEKTLEGGDPADEYANALGEIALGKDFDPFDHCCWPPVVKATARQRAEAFLKTIGKWTE